MNVNKKILTMTIAGMLSAIGIIIPLFSPFKVVLEPASFTLASHVPIFIAMFISPAVAIFVALTTSVGFFMAGYPIVIVIRALTHLIFAVAGAYILKKNKNILMSYRTAIPFVLFISLLHAIAEVIVSSAFYFTNQQGENYVSIVLGLVGVGTIVHSSVDFIISAFIWVPLQHVINIPANAKIRIKTARG